MIYNNLTLAKLISLTSEKSYPALVNELMNLSAISHNGFNYERNHISGEWVQK